MKTNWTPKNLTIAGSGIIAALLMLPTLGKGWESLKYAVDAVPTAYAGKAVAEQVQSDFDRYLQSQQQAMEKQQAVADAINAYVQQQQAPTQALPTGLREWDEERQTFWCCPATDRDACFDEQWWERCD